MIASINKVLEGVTVLLGLINKRANVFEGV